MTSSSKQDDDSLTRLERWFRGIRIGSSSASSSSSRPTKPLPRTPPGRTSQHASTSSAQLVPLPSILAHLEEPSTSPRQPTVPSFPRSSVPDPSSSRPGDSQPSPHGRAQPPPSSTHASTSRLELPQPWTSQCSEIRLLAVKQPDSNSPISALAFRQPASSCSHWQQLPTNEPQYLGITGPRDVRVNASRRLPRPPPFVPLSASAAPNRHDLPHSLQPGASFSQTPSYPGQLVPQEKQKLRSADPVQSAPSSHIANSYGKENHEAREVKAPPRRRQSASASPAPADGSKTASGSQSDAHVVPAREIKTPPRRRAGASVNPTQELGTFSPNGSQTNVNRPPSKGQCWGIKKDGTRCTRKRPSDTPASPAAKARTEPANRQISPLRSNRVAAPARPAQRLTASNPVSIDKSEEEEEEEEDDDYSPSTEFEEVHYCHQHVAEVLKLPGFYHVHSADAREQKNSEVYIKYDDWFGTGPLNDHTKALLRHCMSRPVSAKDQSERGHVYIHELIALSTESHICLKVGRSTKPFSRYGQWRVQCQSKQPVLRAIFPSTKDQGLIPGMDAPTLPGIHLSRRWERLVHLELEALGRRVSDACPDCGRHHREIFKLPRWIEGNDDRREQQPGGFGLASRVILKWMSFVQKLDSPFSA